MSADTLLFNLFRRKKRQWTRHALAGLTQEDVDEINAVLAERDRQKAAEAAQERDTAPTEAQPVPDSGEAAGGALRASQAAIDLIKEFEGLHRVRSDGLVEAYPDPASGGDPWTIGYGATGPDIGKGTVWSKAVAELRLSQDVQRFAAGVAKLLGDAPTRQREFDAMVSLAFNIGLGAFGKSTLLKKHRAGDKAGAASEFHKWRMAAGKVMKGLVRRRAAESALYSGGPR